MPNSVFQLIFLINCYAIVASCPNTVMTTENVATPQIYAEPTSQDQRVPPSSPAPSSTSTCGHSVYYNSDPSYPGSRIIGGINAEQNMYPWLVRLSIRTNGQTTSTACAGAIIGERWIITAAHCVGSSDYAIVYFAEHDKADANEAGEFMLRASSLIVHPDFSYTTVDYDFALLQLDDTLNFSNTWSVQKICLPSSCNDDECEEGRVAYITGWGYVNEDPVERPSDLQTAYVNIEPRSVCSLYWQSYFTEQMMCAGYVETGGVATCFGDSGGPLMTIEDGAYKICGITSFGYEGDCGISGYVPVFSRVCSIRSWITEQTGI